MGKPQTTGGFPESIPVAIHGAVQPDNALVDSWYQRPPYIALKVVGAGYPEDGSEPFWSGHWVTQLSGHIAVPPDLIETHADLTLRVEVRDFQFGTRVGESPFLPASPITIQVDL